MKNFSARVVTFKLAAALEQYEEDLRALAESWVDAALFRRVVQQFGELRILGASVPRLSANWVAVLISRARLLEALYGRSQPVLAALQEHLAAVESLHQRCVRSMVTPAAAPALGG